MMDFKKVPKAEEVNVPVTDWRLVRDPVRQSVFVVVLWSSSTSRHHRPKRSDSLFQTNDLAKGRVPLLQQTCDLIGGGVPEPEETKLRVATGGQVRGD